MPGHAETVQVAALVPQELADKLRALARRSERSAAAELRLAIRAWVEAAEPIERAA
ncbi:MAG: hypothetical protein LC798_21800 [Chloroflexi bacterium]|nr:hypothetical protein [Chloroflexota bacterium]